jgi:tetratricopeptide (TPR) repeat protein
VNPSRHGDLATVLYNAGQYPEALTVYHKVLDLNPTRAAIHLDIGVVLLAQGKPLAALAEWDLEKDKDLRENCLCRVLAYDALGRSAEANAIFARLEQSQTEKYPYDIGLVHASRGELDQAFKWFDKAYRLHDNDLLWIKVDPFLKSVHSDPRFSALLKKMGLSD